MAKFQSQDAVNYAIKYALKENPNFKKFKNDCTNFVSQCLLAGGWPMVGSGWFTSRKDDDVWWYGKGVLADASYTWGGAHNFMAFVESSGRGVKATKDEMAPGDVIQILFNDHADHTMIVTGGNCTTAGNQLLMSYHTTNRLNKSLTEIEKSYDPDLYSFVYWKLAETF